MSKLIPMEEAAASIHDGATLTAGGFAHSHQPMAFVRALIRAGARDLSLISVAECWVAEYLAAAGMLRRAWFSNFMFEGYGRCQCFSRGVEAGRIEVEDHSHFGMIARLVAGGMGLPFMPVRTMLGTDIVEVAGFEPPAEKSVRLRSPFGHTSNPPSGPPSGNDEVLAVAALRPDVAIVHVARADVLGNVQLFGATSVIEEQARASRRVIVTAEEIVDTDVIRRQPELTLLPGLMVDAVVHAPYGAHPTGVHGYYDHDAAHLRAFYDASRTDATIGAWLDTTVRAPRDEWDYLDRVGAARLMRLRVDPARGTARHEVPA